MDLANMRRQGVRNLVAFCLEPISKLRLIADGL
jgi:hypothetical protein